MKSLFLTLLVIFLAASANAQQSPSENPFAQQPQPKHAGALQLQPKNANALQLEPKKFAFDFGDAAILGSFSADEISSRPCIPCNTREVGAIKDQKTRIALKAGVYGAIKLTEYFYRSENDRKILKWFKVGVGAAFGLVAARNFKLRSN